MPRVHECMQCGEQQHLADIFAAKLHILGHRTIEISIGQFLDVGDCRLANLIEQFQVAIFIEEAGVLVYGRPFWSM